MRLVMWTTLVMVAFAANSLLTRAALADGLLTPMTFAAVRAGAGALVLAGLVLARGGRLPLTSPGRAAGVAALTVYLLGFSAAYDALDAGVGALLLFGAVQLTMFGGALAAGEAVPPLRWVGAAVALAGLGWLLWPSGPVAVSPLHAALMAAAGAGWGVYSLVGRGAEDPLGATAANFVLAAPVCLLALMVPMEGASVTAAGVGLAVVSGAVTSGLGYALWYSVLPQLSASVAGVAQLTVPVIALLGGAVLLGEPVGGGLVAACAVVLGGVGLSLLGTRRRS